MRLGTGATAAAAVSAAVGLASEILADMFRFRVLADLFLPQP